MLKVFSATLIQRALRLVVVLGLLFSLSACLGTVVGAVVDTTIEVVKIPFKVGGAIVDVITKDDFSEAQLSAEQASDTIGSLE